MGKKTLLLLFFWLSVASLHGQDNKIGVLSSKISTLVFKEDILDTEVGSPDYFIKAKGRYLLIRAKHNRVRPTSLFVRYGKHKDHYIAELFPDENAPLKYYIGTDPATAKATVADQEPPVLSSKNAKQVYYSIGVKQHGIKIILTDIIHTDNATYLQLFIDNHSSIDLCLSHWTFEYVTILKKFLFSRRKKKKSRLVAPIAAPAPIHVPSACGKYIAFAIPTHVSNGGLEIFLSERDGEREFRFVIPIKVLLKAKNKYL